MSQSLFTGYGSWNGSHLVELFLFIPPRLTPYAPATGFSSPWQGTVEKQLLQYLSSRSNSSLSFGGWGLARTLALKTSEGEWIPSCERGYLIQSLVHKTADKNCLERTMVCFVKLSYWGRGSKYKKYKTKYRLFTCSRYCTTMAVCCLFKPVLWVAYLLQHLLSKHLLSLAFHIKQSKSFRASIENPAYTSVARASVNQ